ncbi:hypothetical protein GCM10022254_55120 [Actinomadura meridiana]|uniref:Uncharacterized protein n=1 Tax=Actinomadura meridiana TaxID=559626 RepID=A0ABP8CFK8_9ACTN
MTDYKLSLVLDNYSYTHLKNHGFTLCGFKAAGVSDPHASDPLVWFTTNQYHTVSPIIVSGAFQIFISEPVKGDGPITSYSTYDIHLKERYIVTSETGDGKIEEGYDKTHVVIDNQTKKKFSTGLAGSVSVANEKIGSSLYCVSPLAGWSPANLRPVEKLLLCFTSENASKGKVVRKAPANSILVDLTAASAEDAPEINYSSKDDKWSWPAGTTWAEQIKKDQELRSHLISG